MKENMVTIMRKGFFLAGLLLTLVCSAGAQKANSLSAAQQEEIKKVEDTLAILSYTVLNDSLATNRFAACRQLIPTLVRALKTPNSFRHSFNRLTNISIQYPADSTFRIFSWQLYVDKDDYRYYGAIQMNSGELKLFPLIDRSYEVEENLERQPLSPEKWYGAVYYNLHQVDSPKGRYYLLFGFDGFEFFRKRKVMEVLHFDRSGKPVFGAPVFTDPSGKNRALAGLQRLVLEYSAASSVRLNYDEALEMVIFDHLIEMNGQYNEGPVNLPDGSYEGFRLEKGLLSYVENVWTQTSDEAPRPMPVLDGKKKDIIGNR